MKTRPTRRGGFTLIDVMIVVVCIGIMAAIVLPQVIRHIDEAEEAAKQTTFESVRKALDLYHLQKGAWPAAITPDLFVSHETPRLPAGLAFNYDPATGALAIVAAP